MRPRVAPQPHLPALPMVSPRVAPRARSLGYPWRMAPRVASHSTPSDGAIAASTGCPASRSYGWADLTPRLKANLASPARPWMNLCFLPAPAHSLLALDVISLEPRTSLPSPAVERRARSDFASS